MSEVTVIVSGPIGSGKSAIVGEIEIAMRAIGISVRWADPKAEQSEKNMTHADWQKAIEAYNPSVVLVEVINRSLPPMALASLSEAESVHAVERHSIGKRISCNDGQACAFPHYGGCRLDACVRKQHHEMAEKMVQTAREQLRQPSTREIVEDAIRKSKDLEATYTSPPPAPEAVRLLREAEKYAGEQKPDAHGVGADLYVRIRDYLSTLPA